LTAHMDPVDTNDPHREPLSHIIRDAISDMPGVLSFHDLRIVPGKTHTNVIFDIVLSPECKTCQGEIVETLSKKISEFNPNFFCVIEFDVNYIKTSK